MSTDLIALRRTLDQATAVYQGFLQQNVAGLSVEERVELDLAAARAFEVFYQADRAYRTAIAGAAGAL